MEQVLIQPVKSWSCFILELEGGTHIEKACYNEMNTVKAF